MTQPTPIHLRFAERLNIASGWSVWNPYHPGTGRLEYECKAQDISVHFATRGLRKFLETTSVVGFSVDGQPPFKPGSPMLELNNERSLCLSTANDQDMDVAITLLETIARPALRYAMRTLALNTDFTEALQEIARTKRYDFTEYLSRVFNDAGVINRNYLEPAGNGKPAELQQRFYIDATHCGTLDNVMQPKTKCPPDLKAIVREAIPVLDELF